MSVFMAASTAQADSLSVINPPNGPLERSRGSLKVVHDNTDVAYVQSDKPTAQTDFSISFVFKVESVAFSGAPTNMHQPIFTAHSPNPNPGGGSCGTAQFTTAFRCFHQLTNNGANDNVMCWAKDNQCVDVATPSVAITRGQEYRVCVYWYRGSSGKVGITVVAANAVCPAWTETLAWSTATRNNSLLNIELIRLGTPQLNNFAAGETIVYKFDSFFALTERMPSLP